ncbi:MAG: hypothetical protein QOE70_4056 [Chthoniobacter sp.]|jgi:hypothetical protein|nr:hypothetical protein [Chthoniobacter sp.]
MTPNHNNKIAGAIIFFGVGGTGMYALCTNSLPQRLGPPLHGTQAIAWGIVLVVTGVATGICLFRAK